MKKLLLLLIFPLFLGSTSKYQYKYEIPFAPVIYQGVNDSIPTIDQFGRIRNGIIAQRIIDTMNNDPSGVDLTRAEQDYVRAIVGGLYITGMWQRTTAMYPMVGGNAWKHKWNWKDMRDLDAAFRLTFPNGMTHDSFGITGNGSNHYANTFFKPRTNLGNSSLSFSAYSSKNTAEATNRIILGALNVSDLSIVNIAFTTIVETGISSSSGNDYGNTPIRADNKGYVLIKTGIGVNSLFYGGVMKAFTNKLNGSLSSDDNIYLLARNQASSPVLASTKSLGFAHLGPGLTDQIAINSSHVITYSQGILNRQ